MGRTGLFSPRCAGFAVSLGVLLFAGREAFATEDTSSIKPPSFEDLQSLSLEQLGQLEVTSVSKRPESLSEAAAAIFVITASDIRRSGVTTLPEVLRMAPNLEVARINAYSWTVTARGFNSPETSNKLLVLIDGRSVYEPVASTVLWPQVDVPLENIERIEIISGPGGTLWGANAVNGVINIITKNAAETKDVYVRGTFAPNRQTGMLRAGGKLGDQTTYRVYLESVATGKTRAAEASDTSDDSYTGVNSGARLDGAFGADQYSIEVNGYRNAIASAGGVFLGNSTQGSWTHPLQNGSVIELSAYYDRDERQSPTLHEDRNMFNLDAQQRMTLSNAQNLVWGFQIQTWRDVFNSYDAFYFQKPATTISLGSLFVQDELSLRPDLKLTLGLKAEDNNYSGLDGSPNIRLAWRQSSNSLFWGAISRAVRTPNRVERELQAMPFLVPSPRFQSEKVTAFEAGWRGQPTPRLTFDLNTYYNLYYDLRTDGYPATIFPVILQNGGEGRTYGAEGWGRYQVVTNWRISAGFSLLHKSFWLRSGYNDLTNLAVGGQDPNYQVQLRSEWNVRPDVEFDVALRRVGQVHDTAVPVPAYTEATAHVAWQVTKKIELALIGGNLLHSQHIEVWDPSTAAPRFIGRSASASIRYGF